MTVGLVKENIRQFLMTDIAEVLVIKGKWGVGKTHTWQESIKEYKNELKIKSYSYVSLFGVHSLDELKRAIVLNTVNAKTDEGNLSTESRNTEWNVKAKKMFTNLYEKTRQKSTTVAKNSADAIKDIELFGFAGGGRIIDSIMYSTLSKTIVCFDDLERHSASLELRDILGMASFLKEQKQCKIVILLNEDADKERLSDYFKYKEKIVDKQLHYEPTTQECFDHAIKEHDYLDKIKNCCCSLTIKNIRVLKQINMHTRNLLEHLTEHDDSIKLAIIQSTVVICWTYYCHASDKENIPNFKFIQQNEMFGMIDEKINEKESRWGKILYAYGYQKTDELDLLIAKSIELGFVDKEKLLALCNAKQQEVIKVDHKTLYNDAWDLFHSSFDDNTIDVIEAMKKGLESSVKTLSTSEYSQGVKLIRDLQDNMTADELTQFYIDSWKHDDYNIFNLDDIGLHPFSVSDDIFASALRKAYKESASLPSPKEILDKWKGQNSYNAADAEILAELSKDELKDMIKKLKGKDSYKYIRTCIMMGSSNDTLRKNVNLALTEIGNESPLNKARLGKFSL